MSHSQRTLISSASPFEAQIGYSRAVVSGDWIFISGTTGYSHPPSPQPSILPPSITAQLHNALHTISSTLQSAQSSIADIVRIRYILRDAKEFPACWPTLREWFGDVRPAATMWEAGLMEEGMRIEVEVTARRGGGGKGEGKDEEGVGGMV